jgi:hypothetical protein
MELLATLEDKYRLPRGLLNAVVQTESGGDVNAISPKGAEGAFQFMPNTAKAYNVNVKDFNSSADGAARMYADLLLAHNGDLDKALASYNWGQGNLAKYGMDKMPSETKNYIAKVKSKIGEGDMAEQDWELVKPAQKASNDDWELVKPAQPKKYSNNPLNPAFYNDLSLKNVPQNVGNLVSGFVRGSGSIGSTLLAPYDVAKDAIAGKGLTLDSNIKRRQGIDEGLQQVGANPESGLYSLGKLGGEVAGTAGMGNVLAIGAKGAPIIQTALKTGGLSLNGLTTGSKLADLALKTGAGASVAGLSGGLIDPRTAKTSALIGGAIPFGQEAIKAGGRVTADVIGNLLTHSGGESIKQATKAGFEGGEKLKAVVDNMHKNVPIDDVLSDVRQNINIMGQKKSELYRSGMVDIAKDKTALSFDGIDNSINSALNSVSYKGKVTNESAYKKLSDVQEIVNDWKASNPQEFHTPEGMDKLKQKVGAILEDIPYEQSSARRIVGDIYHSIKGEISKQAPTYAKVMKDYGDATEQVNEIRKALIGGNKASADTSLRKLQSIMRNNVNSNYGNRLSMANKMVESGGKDILPALAGQSLSNWTPRGLGNLLGGATILGGAAMMDLPMALPALAVQSPRLMGYGAIGTGLIGRGVNEAVKPAIPAIGALTNYLEN